MLGGRRRTRASAPSPPRCASPTAARCSTRPGSSWTGSASPPTGWWGCRSHESPRARALRGVRGHRRRGAVQARDARPGGRLRRDFFAFFEDADLAWRARHTAGGPVRAPGRRLPPPLATARTARRRSSTSWVATGCARSPRTPPPGCCSSTGRGCSSTTPPTSLCVDQRPHARAAARAPARACANGAATGAAAPRTGVPCGSSARSASAARCSATGATPSTSTPAAELR